ncbi:MAG: citramalate synthase, partial [Nitrososphaerales archaeon]
MVRKRFVEILDTTLRDGAQTRGVSFSKQDKVSIALRLDELGVSYIEGGWPGSNPKDQEFFRSIKDYSMKNAEIVAFGSTRKKGISAKEDKILNTLIKSEVDTAVIFGKSWTLHVEKVFRTSLEENLDMIEDTVSYLKANGLNVIYDAEHFFDGYKENPKYALSTLKAAEKGGASILILCDTNGGSLPLEVGNSVRAAKKAIKIPFGIHTHNDGGCAVANTLVAIEEGGSQFQGTVNGLGERCGNVDICQVIPALERKLGVRCLKGPEENLKGLTALSKYVYELANQRPSESQPYVGRNAFSHKGGVHIDAMLKTPRTYEHLEPSTVGNTRELMISELSGKAGILSKASELGLNLDKKSPAVDDILA